MGERREILVAEDEKDEWVKLEWVDIEPGEEAEDLRDIAPESRRMGLASSRLIQHTREWSRAGWAGMTWGILKDLNPAEILPVNLSDTH